jgi:hypothetical protein
MSRANAERTVERLGGRATHSVTHATHLVVAGFAPGSKRDCARALGIPVASERGFLARYYPSLREDSRLIPVSSSRRGSIYRRFSTSTHAGGLVTPPRSFPARNR